MQSLNIWLVQTGEELPLDAGPPRLLRTALLAEELTARGHRVTFWNSTFNHQQKVQRAKRTTETTSPSGYRIILLFGRPYRRNISFARVFSQRENAREFRKLAPSQPSPDVILAGMPPIELPAASVAFAAERAVPCAVDCRDMWPDVIGQSVPPLLRILVAPGLALWRRQLRQALRRSTGITAVSPGFLSWALEAAGRQQAEQDRSFTLTLSATLPDAEDVAKAEVYWNDVLGPCSVGVKIGVFAGTLSRRLDIMTMVDAMVGLPKGTPLKLVICGKGDLEAEIRERTQNSPFVVFAGWKSAAELRALMARADFGALPYPSTRDFTSSFPNKVGEYLSFGLPIFTGVGGDTQAVLAPSNLAFNYTPGDVESARRALIDIAADTSVKSDRALAARKIFEDFFDPSKIYPAFADYLEQLAHSGVRQ